MVSQPEQIARHFHLLAVTGRTISPACDARHRVMGSDAMVVVASAERCIRCGSCAVLAPGVFEVARRVQVKRQPEGDAERARCEAAALVCPTQAIRSER